MRDGGHDAIHLRDLRLQRMPDKGVFNKAINEGRIILTFDLDFGEILSLASGRAASVVLFRLNNTTPPFLIARLQATLAEASEALIAGAIVVVEDARLRIRRIPPTE